MTSVATSDGDLGPISRLHEAGSPAVGDQDDGDHDDVSPRGDEQGDSGEPKARSAGSARSADINEHAGLGDSHVAMVDAEGLRAMGELASALSYLWIPLDPPGPQHRGRLGLYLEEAIEHQLEERGALPPGIQASTGLDASLSDQLYRARLVEMRGIALGIPSLEGIVNLGRSLDADDSAVLRWWIAAATDRPVHLVISKENTKLRVYPSPVLFETLFEVAHMPVTPRPPSTCMADSSASMDLSDLPPEVEQTNVLGTEVESAEAFWGAEAPTVRVANGEVRADESLDDVELPDLDRALGLTPPLEEHPPLRADEPQMGAAIFDEPSPQLPLAYESPAPAVVRTQSLGDRAPSETRIASPAPPATQIDDTEERAQAEVSPRAPEEPPFVPHRQSAHEATLSASDFGDIDEEEFLRTLEEDSSRAPSVQAEEPQHPDEGDAPSVWAAEREFADESDALSAQTVAQPEPADKAAAPFDEGSAGRQEGPSPLPTKRIARNPFIRLADPSLAVSAPESDVPSAVDTADVQAAVDQGSIHAVTLCGAAAPDPNDPFNQLAAREWKTWVTNLEAARGPKPLSVIERMFVTDYTRLREAVRRGVAPQSAESILSEWQESFARSYSEAFDALRVRGKRPTMVLDIPEMASRLGRLQGAKRVQLLLVDGLRFDLGLMVQDRMRELADVALTERLLLWSALPSVTQYQLELLGKGPDGLKEQGMGDESPALVARGAAARVPRRVRTGRLELFKLDVVEDSLREVGAPVSERMDSIADETAAAIADHLSKQAARTMVVVFGDHGFSLDPKKAGTSEEVRQGGSSPEEVLVPAFAWLTGAVH